MRRALLTLALAACFGGGHGLPQDAPVGDPTAKRVVALADLSGAFERSPYARATDSLELLFFAQVRLAFAGDGTACPISSRSPWWAVAQRGTNLPCPAGWRRAR